MHLPIIKKITDSGRFPASVLELLQALWKEGLFEDAMLIGSWVMPLHNEMFGIDYVLRTLDIDFAVKFATDRHVTIDLDKVITYLGYIPVIMQTGSRRFTRENFTIEFIAHRRGGKDGQAVSIKKWNIIASPLPFIDILLDFPAIAEFADFNVRVPVPEAFFVHKLITARRRPSDGKKAKDLEQCSIIAPRIDRERLKRRLLDH
jgi:hypothetical protein